MQRTEFRAMGSHMLALIDSDSPQALGSLERVPVLFEAWEQALSRFRPDSELSILNAAEGREVKVSKVTWDVMNAALDAAHYSEGLVVPTLLTALVSAGYDRTFDDVKVAGAQTAQQASSADRYEPQTDWRQIKLNRRNQSITLTKDMKIDFGGVAKGWAADQAASVLSNYGPAIVDAGGDIAVSGPMSDGSPWPIGVDSPIEPDEQLELLMIPVGAVATSGRDYRRWKQGDRWQHHIIDPRTGRPAETDVLSATVVGPSTVLAEVAAKAALILGSEAGMAWIEERPDLAGLLVLEDGQVLHSSKLTQYRWS